MTCTTPEAGEQPTQSSFQNEADSPAALGGAGRRPRLRPYSANMNAPCVGARHPPIAPRQGAASPSSDSVISASLRFRSSSIRVTCSSVSFDAIFRAVLLVGANALLFLEVVDHVTTDVPHGDPASSAT